MVKMIRCLCAVLLLIAGVPSVVGAQTAPTAKTMIRRVVTGNRPDGRSYVVSDERVPAGGNLFAASANEPLGLKMEADARVLSSQTFNFGMTTGATALTLFELGPSQPEKPFWHRTTTVDYMMMVSGTIVLMLDEGEVTLRPGDVAIQRNTRHAWRNPSATERASAWVVNSGLPNPDASQGK
jgi:hypothetical protein